MEQWNNKRRRNPRKQNKLSLFVLSRLTAHDKLYSNKRSDNDLIWNSPLFLLHVFDLTRRSCMCVIRCSSCLRSRVQTCSVIDLLHSRLHLFVSLSIEIKWVVVHPWPTQLAKLLNNAYELQDHLLKVWFICLLSLKYLETKSQGILYRISSLFSSTFHGFITRAYAPYSSIRRWSNTNGTCHWIRRGIIPE